MLFGLSLLATFLIELFLGWSKAIRKVKFVPLPHSDWTIMSPPNYLQIIYEICKPKPIPYVFISLVASRNPNNLNNFPKSSFLIPVPVSITYTSNIPFSASETNYFKFD